MVTVLAAWGLTSVNWLRAMAAVRVLSDEIDINLRGYGPLFARVGRLHRTWRGALVIPRYRLLAEQLPTEVKALERVVERTEVPLSSRNNHLILIAILALSVLLRVGVAFYLGNGIEETRGGTYDQISYDMLAQRVAAGTRLQLRRQLLALRTRQPAHGLLVLPLHPLPGRGLRPVRASSPRCPSDPGRGGGPVDALADLSHRQTRIWRRRWA